MKLNLKGIGFVSFLTLASVSFAQTADIKPGMSQDAVQNKLGKPVSIEAKQGEECSWNPGVSALVNHWHYKSFKVVLCDSKVESVLPKKN